MVQLVEHEAQGHRGAFFIEEDGERLGAMTYTRANPSLIVIDHTEVSAVLKGQGAGRRLLDALVAWARETQTKVVPVCPFAKAQFEKDASLRDVLST